MGNAWDRPAEEGSPFRDGDAKAEDLYCAVGRAMSSWERLEGEMVGLYVSLVGSNNYAMDAPAIQAFGTITSPATRANMMRAAAESLFHHLGMQLGLEPAQETIDEADSLEAELIDVLNCYAGWMGRRNDVAHGCVGSVGEDPPTYRLLPSIASAKKWCHVISEPAFTFVAKDLDGFTRGFDELAARTSDLAERILEFRQETARLIATE